MIESDEKSVTEVPETGTASSAAADSSSRRVEDWVTYRRLLSYVKPHWFIFLIAVIGFQFGSGAEAYFVYLFGELIDSWPKTALAIPALMLGAAVIRGIGEILGELLLSRISYTVVHNIRTELFDQLLVMPSAFFDASSQGHLISRITYNVAQLRNTGTDALKTIVQDGGKLIVYVTVMVYLSWKLTLIFIATAPLVGLVVAYASRRFRRISKRIQNTMGDVTHVTSETVSGYRVVKIFGGTRYERDRFHKSSDNNRRQNLKMVATKVTSTQVIQIFVAMALSVLIAVLFQPSIGGHLSTGEVVTFLGLAGMLARPIRKLTEVNARLQRGLAAAEDVFGQLDQSVENDCGSLTVDRAAGKIEFRDVSFRYESGKDRVLQRLNLTIEQGQTVALVGKSGSGKSTLASLIPRFYEPDSGQILLDGTPIQDYSLASLRDQIALVTQAVTLFNDTLERNIAYGGLADASQDQIGEAIRGAHADKFIEEMPDGLKTIVGDDGVLLSGGQRQRVAIARALLKDAPILILDEATSSLDNTSERYIQAALEEVMRGRTTIVIAHRLSTIEKADLILVMQDGQIIESGKHEDLLARGEAYAELYNAQFEDEQGDTGQAAPAVEVPPATRKPSLPRLPPMERNFSPLVKGWYSQSRWPRLLTPLAWLFSRVASRRRLQYLTGRKTPWRAPVPVVVVGNITVGGTGKTPFVIWLARELKQLGFSPGIVSRGYGGSAGTKPTRVGTLTGTDEVGDEAVLLAARTGCPVVVCADRVKAVQELLATRACDIVISDDGLQHYALARDLEIVIIDGHRGVGNGLMIPAGPMREPLSRLAEVDWVISNGKASGQHADETLMCIEPLRFVPLDETTQAINCNEFSRRYPNVNAVAGIGNPTRFVQTLRELGINPFLHAYADHHRFERSELVFDNDWPVVCTEKDAVKLRELEAPGSNIFYLEIAVELDDDGDVSASDRLLSLLHEHGIPGP